MTLSVQSGLARLAVTGNLLLNKDFVGNVKTIFVKEGEHKGELLIATKYFQGSLSRKVIYSNEHAVSGRIAINRIILKSGYEAKECAGDYSMHKVTPKLYKIELRRQ